MTYATGAFTLSNIIITVTALAIIFLAIVLISRFSNRRTAANRVKLIRAFKASPRKAADAPILLHGQASSPGVVMPAGGEPAAFHATFIMSRGCTLIRDMNHRKPLPANSSFKVFITSGDFSVTEAGVSYRVSIVSALERITMGAEWFTGKYKMNMVLDGMPENVFDDMVSFEAGSQALVPVFSITETGRSVMSSIDSRVRTFTQGSDVPPGIAEILKGKIIRPQPGEEITVLEFFIPLKKSVWVFGEFDGTDTVRYGEKGAMLSVSYGDPEIAVV